MGDQPPAVAAAGVSSHFIARVVVLPPPRADDPALRRSLTPSLTRPTTAEGQPRGRVRVVSVGAAGDDGPPPHPSFVVRAPNLISGPDFLLLALSALRDEMLCAADPTLPHNAGHLDEASGEVTEAPLLEMWARYTLPSVYVEDYALHVASVDARRPEGGPPIEDPRQLLLNAPGVHFPYTFALVGFPQGQRPRSVTDVARRTRDARAQGTQRTLWPPLQEVQDVMNRRAARRSQLEQHGVDADAPLGSAPAAKEQRKSVRVAHLRAHSLRHSQRGLLRPPLSPSDRVAEMGSMMQLLGLTPYDVARFGSDAAAADAADECLREGTELQARAVAAARLESVTQKLHDCEAAEAYAAEMAALRNARVAESKREAQAAREARERMTALDHARLKADHFGSVVAQRHQERPVPSASVAGLVATHSAPHRASSPRRDHAGAERRVEAQLEQQTTDRRALMAQAPVFQGPLCAALHAGAAKQQRDVSDMRQVTQMRGLVEQLHRECDRDKTAAEAVQAGAQQRRRRQLEAEEELHAARQVEQALRGKREAERTRRLRLEWQSREVAALTQAMAP